MWGYRAVSRDGLWERLLGELHINHEGTKIKVNERSYLNHKLLIVKYAASYAQMILIIVETYSKWPEAILVNNTDSEPACHHLGNVSPDTEL